MNKNKILNLTKEFFKWLYIQDDYSKYYVNGEFKFELLLQDFRDVISNKIGKKNFVKIVTNLLDLSNINLENVNQKYILNLHDYKYHLRKSAYKSVKLLATKQKKYF